MAKKKQVRKIGSDLQTKLGQAVRACRTRLKLSQEELAWRASIHRTYLADIERGARNVTLRSVANLAAALQVTVGNLLSYASVSGDPQPSLARVSTPRCVREILLIEDSATDAAITARAFARANIANPLRIVRDAETGLDCLLATGRFARSRPLRPQLILLDLNLPQMSGLEFLRRIKADERTQDIPVVVMTVSQSDRMIIECGRLGAENYIVKPLGIDRLIRITPRLNLQLTVGPLRHPRFRETSP